MIKKCYNCQYLGFGEEERWTYIKQVYHCKLHNCKVDYPKEQFCGDENWISIKSKERLEKLKQLGI